jgi:hypothetical protein
MTTNGIMLRMLVFEPPGTVSRLREMPDIKDKYQMYMIDLVAIVFVGFYRICDGNNYGYHDQKTGN